MLLNTFKNKERPQTQNYINNGKIITFGVTIIIYNVQTSYQMNEDTISSSLMNVRK